MILTIVGIIFRVAELVFAAIVAGITGDYLESVSDTEVDEQGRFIYTVVVAGLAIIFSLVWLLPFTRGFLSWPSDIFMSILWWVAFGLLVDYIGDGCGYVFNWDNIRIRGDNTCAKWKADIAFCFLSALCWLVSAIVGFLALRKARKAHDAGGTTTRRRKWYHRSRV